MNQNNLTSYRSARPPTWVGYIALACIITVSIFANNLNAAALDNAVESNKTAVASVFPPVVSGQFSEFLAQPESVGSARLTYLFFDVYDATLWVERPLAGSQLSAQQGWKMLAPLVLELKYLRKLHGEKIAERSLKEMNELGLDNAEQEQRWLEFMLTTFPTVNEGDVIAGAYAAEGQTAFYLNGEKIGEIDDPAFGEYFFAIWLDVDTSEPKMREQLLGLAAD